MANKIANKTAQVHIDLAKFLIEGLIGQPQINAMASSKFCYHPEDNLHPLG